jgi:hypothetical protein
MMMPPGNGPARRFGQLGDSAQRVELPRPFTQSKYLVDFGTTLSLLPDPKAFSAGQRRKINNFDDSGMCA